MLLLLIGFEGLFFLSFPWTVMVATLAAGALWPSFEVYFA
jgi:hypothetical protein